MQTLKDFTGIHHAHGPINFVNYLTTCSQCSAEFLAVESTAALRPANSKTGEVLVFCTDCTACPCGGSTTRPHSSSCTDT